MDETPEELVDEAAKQLEALLPLVGEIYSLRTRRRTAPRDLWPGDLGRGDRPVLSEARSLAETSHSSTW